MKKIELAIEIVKESTNKKSALETMVEKLNVTRSNAFVYYTKASKALGLTPVKTSNKTYQVSDVDKMLNNVFASKSRVESFIEEVKSN